MRLNIVLWLVCVISLTLIIDCNSSSGHDTWVETGSNRVRSGEYVYIDLRLGNHGNNHRDFKLASKVTLAPCSLSVQDPHGLTHDLKSRIVDLGNAEKEGYWTSRFVPETPGVYHVLHQLKLLKGRMNVIKNSRTFFYADASGSADTVAKSSDLAMPSSDQLDLLLETPFESLEAGKAVVFKLYFKGKPLAGARLSVIPRGITLTEEMDPSYEFLSEPNGTVHFVPNEGNLYLAVVHHVADDETGEGYDRTHYGSTMVLAIPNQAINASRVP